MPHLSHPTFLADLATVWHLSLMRTWGIIAVIATLATSALAAIDPNSGIDFVTIGAVNNPAWTGGGSNNNRGSVGYVYNIGKYEVTTAQWVEFFNAVLDRPTTDRVPFVAQPYALAATRVTPTTPGAIRYGVVPGRDMFPVNGISWRTAAIYCNWLHNGKATNRDAFLNGAYDVSTFGPGPENIGFVDQLTHNPGARYWIPTQDEWIKAAHFDPNKPNADGTTGGWWSNANSSDSFPAYGPVGVHARTNFPLGPDPNGPLASANAGWTTEFPGYWLDEIPLGAYVNAVSPWGLYDTAGGTSEWTEGYLGDPIDGIPRARYADGSAMGVQSLVGDQARAVAAAVAPYEALPGIGLRLATSVPTPSSLALSIAALAFGSRRKRRACVIVAATLATPALAAIDPNSGIEFVTVGAVNNPAWTGGGTNNNRGSVGYEYNIGKFEVTTAQWAEFMNAALDRPATDRIPAVQYPSIWGAMAVPPANSGGRRYVVQPGRENIPVGGITWRTAAIYANWLHNGKSTNSDAFLSGAYDVSTFGTGPFGVGFTDQLTRSPGARYWIPSLDEWMKAAHYDPNMPNADGTVGGWWQYSTSSDSPILYGPAGQFAPGGRPFEANGVWTSDAFPGFNPFSIPLGAYTDVVSPWGLYDVAGGTSEWTETPLYFTGDVYPRFRITDGSAWASAASGTTDSAGSRWSAYGPTHTGYDAGLRIASSIPAPGSALIGACVLVGAGWSRRRRCERVSRCS